MAVYVHNLFLPNVAICSQEHFTYKKLMNCGGCGVVPITTLSHGHSRLRSENVQKFVTRRPLNSVM